MNTLPVRRALISVYDKTGLEELGRGLAAAGVELVSTGSTAARLTAAGVRVTPVEELTGFPECLDGRVKTLHPRVHAGILADRRLPDHVQQLADLGVEAFDLVVVNLYPFAATVASGATPDECVEQIDIGGPTMVRAAAKNHPSVAVVVDPSSYGAVLATVGTGGFTFEQRRALAAVAFRHTASYDVAVAGWFASSYDDSDATAGFPAWFGGTWERAAVLRYGENPHQQAALYLNGLGGLAEAEQLHGKEMSYNNYVDSDAAWRAAHDHGDQPTVAIIKHANPCGIAVGVDVAQAHRHAHACDPVSAFGGVIATNVPVSLAMAEQVKDVFTEVVLAPGYENGVVELLSRKPSVRLLVVPPGGPSPVEMRPISGGLLMQVADRLQAPGDDPAAWTLATGEPLDDLADLAFAWRAIRAVKSNAILLAAGGATVGVGMGQVNRVDSARLAVARAGDRARGAVAASDAFFPFADGLQVLLDAGVRAVVQPGGSVRDEEVVAAAAAAGVSMYLTGTRHFAHRGPRPRVQRFGEDLTRLDLSRQELTAERFEDCRLVGADLSEAVLDRCVFDRCDLSGADLGSLVARGCACLSCRFERTRLVLARLEECKLTGSTFLRADLRSTTVVGGDWSYVLLRGQDLRGVSLARLRLAEADLSDADLRAADLSGADLRHTRLRGARLKGLDLRGALLDGCDLLGVSWEGVRIDLGQAVQLARSLGALVEE